VNFGHRPWWYGGNFCQKTGKIRKEIISKRNNLKKGKNGGSK
jgi:hypothetical protein